MLIQANRLMKAIEMEGLTKGIALQAVRDAKRLWALKSTVECMLKGCTPCAYKLIVNAPKYEDGVPLVPPCRRNKRPEECPRHGHDPANYSGLYKKEQRILIVGDGDFSFSLALASAFGKGGNLVCTSYHELDHLKTIYPSVEENVKRIKELAQTVQHSVDATRLARTLDTKDAKFDRIVFNFPCVDIPNGQDGQTEELQANQNLIRSFLRNCFELLDTETKAEVHIVHKTKAPFSWWKMSELADDPECELKHQINIVFDRSAYPLYTPRKVNDKKSFPVFDALTYVFVPKNEDTGKDDDEGPEDLLTLEKLYQESGEIVRMSKTRLRQVVSMLQLPSPLRASRKADGSQKPLHLPGNLPSSGRSRRGRKRKRSGKS